MTEERDPKVSAAYRDLGAEEPPRALDDAILAAARREAGFRPSAFSSRTGRQRWYAPLATAALLVLAVAVTLNMQIERPGIESPAQQAAAPPSAVRELAKSVEKQIENDAATPATKDEVKITRRKVADQAATPATAAPAPTEAREPKPFMPQKPSIAGRLERGEATAQAEAPARLLAQKLADTPERELERIAELRAQGRHDEADKALAEFRKRYPDYRIPEAMRERLERR